MNLTMDKKYKLNGIDFLETEKGTLIGIHQGKVDCYYPWKDLEKPTSIKCVMMDLDGTSVKSEEFWVYIIEKTTATLLNDPSFRLSNVDNPYVQGFTTIEHLSYCKNKYKFRQSLEEAILIYHQVARKELKDILLGKGKNGAFSPRKGLKKFLFYLKKKNIKIGLATSGLDYKAIPEIVSAFKELDMGDPLSFYDCIITGGKEKKKEEYGTMGELCAKPHPWIYSELALGLGIKNKKEAIIIEDSSAGVISGKIAGYNVIGFSDGNLIESGLDKDCLKMVSTFEEIDL